MKIYKLSAGAAIIIALCLVFWPPADVNAETDQESVTLSYHSQATPSSATRASGSNATEERWVEVGTADEFFEALQDRIRNIRLTDDIIIEDGTFYQISSGRGVLTLVDIGEHTIYVDGTLDIMPEMTFTGRGGEEGLFHVNDGGFLVMCGVSVIAEDGIAVWQEDGAVFLHYNLLEEQGAEKDYIYYSQGENRFPDKPVAWYPTGYYNYFGMEREPFEKMIVVGPEDDFSEEQLPREDYAVWCIDGIAYEGELDVTWEIAGEEEALADRKRTFLVGNYSDDYVTFLQPECLVAFQREHAGVMLHCEIEDYGSFIYALIYMAPFDEGVSADDYSLMISSDGKQWEVCSDVWKEKTSKGLIRFDRIFYEEEEAYPKYYFISVEHEGTSYGSDTLMLSDMNQLVSSDVDGSRGGGTELLPGYEPPETGGSDGMAGSGEEKEDSGDSPEEEETNDESKTLEPEISEMSKISEISEVSEMPEILEMSEIQPHEPEINSAAGTYGAHENSQPDTMNKPEMNQKESRVENPSNLPAENALEHKAAAVIQSNPVPVPEAKPALTASSQILAGCIITVLIFLFFLFHRKK